MYIQAAVFTGRNDVHGGLSLTDNDARKPTARAKRSFVVSYK